MIREAAQLAVFQHRLAGVAETMGATLRRAAYSANIKERLDYSCAVFDAGCRLLAQAAHIPVHLGAMEATVRAASGGRTWRPGDVVVMNDPFAGGSHLPDLTTVSPVFIQGRIRAFLATRAHHADVGGIAPGSMAPARELVAEGLIIPAVLLATADGPCADTVAFIVANSRTPEEREGDLAAQLAAHTRGEVRLREVIDELEEVARGSDRAGPIRRFDEMARLSLDRAAAASEALARSFPEGEFEFEDRLDDDGLGSAPPVIRVRVRAAAGTVTVDFTGSSAQTQGNVNAPLAVTQSAVRYVWACLLEPGARNAGSFAGVHVIAPSGTIVNALPPVGVAGGNVETSQRIVDVVLGAFAQAFPSSVPAASQGTMNNLMFGGSRTDGSPFTYYETIAGGAGGGPGGPGAHCIQVHMTNTANTPVEALESAYPVRVVGYERRRGSGGAGASPGGDGVVRRIRFLVPARVTLLSDRRTGRPYGLAGGLAGAAGENRLIRDGEVDAALGGKATFDVGAGDTVAIATPGGGGWGVPPSAPAEEARTG